MPNKLLEMIRVPRGNLKKSGLSNTLTKDKINEGTKKNKVEYSGMKYKGKGMDKTYYHKDGERFGWIETKQDVITSEFEGYWEILKMWGLETNIPVLLKMDDKPMPEESILGKDKKEIEADKGYWFEHIPYEKAIKPVKQIKEVDLDFMKSIKHLNENQLNETVKGLRNIRNNLDGISSVVGELILAVRKDTGVPVIMEFSAGKDGIVGGYELIRNASKGIDNMIKSTEKMIDVREKNK